MHELNHFQQLINRIKFAFYFHPKLWALRRQFYRKHPSDFEKEGLRLQTAVKLLDKRKSEIDLAINHLNFVPSYRMDGIGIQVLIRIAVYELAQQKKAQYVHYPFIEIEHQNQDQEGKRMSTWKWAKIWESFFNLADGECSIANWIEKTGQWETAKRLSTSKRYLDDFSNNSTILNGTLEEIEVKKAGDYVFSLGLVRNAKQLSFYLSESTVQKLQAKYLTSAFKHSSATYDLSYFNVSIHIRRGDVWTAISRGNNAKRFEERHLDEGFYADLIDRLYALDRVDSRALRVHIFTDGLEEDFTQLIKQDGEYYWKNPETKVLNGPLSFHSRTSTLDTLKSLIESPILFPAKSTFSLVAAIYGKSKVIYDPVVQTYRHYEFIRPYMSNSDRYITFDDLKNLVPS